MTEDAPRETLATSLYLVGQTSLADIAPEQAARIMRRVTDREALVPRLEVAAFNSAI